MGRTIKRTRNSSEWEFSIGGRKETVRIVARADYLPGGRTGDARVWFRVMDAAGVCIAQDHGSTDIRIHRTWDGKAYEAIVGDQRDRSILGAVEAWASVLLNNFVQNRLKAQDTLSQWVSPDKRLKAAEAAYEALMQVTDLNGTPESQALYAAIRHMRLNP